ncbi:hypothetical protein PVAP13_3KG166400, partial [Panicum virgatum]
MLLWAPFVLVHLGGQDSITAFSRQDNELYWRHLLNLATEVAVAGYVVGRASWPDARLRAAVALVFLAGCVKYAERIWVLFLASPGNLKSWSRFVLSKKLEWRQRQPSREEAVKMTRDSLNILMSKGGSSSGRQLFLDAMPLIPDVISADAPLNQTRNITVAAKNDLPGMLKKFLPSDSDSRLNAYEHVGALLGFCYRRLYTKDLLRERHIIYNDHCLGLIFFAVLDLIFTWVPIPVALALFMAAEKGLHTSSRSAAADIWVSYLLLVGAIALDGASAARFIFFPLSHQLAGMGWIKRQISRDVTRRPITKDHTSIKKFILDTLLVSGTMKKWNIASSRGQVALKKEVEVHSSGDSTTRRTLKEAVEKTVRSGFDFPTSVLIWHIATEICYYSHSDQVEEHNLLREQKMKEDKQVSRELSQYVMYLVFKCGVMLTTNSEVVHDKAEEEIVGVLSSFRRDDLGDKDAVMKLYEAGISKDDEIQMIEHHEEPEEKQDSDHEESPDIDRDAYNHMKKLQQSFEALKSPVLPRACAVAQELISIENEADRWDLIAAVWAEMLYYTAARCGGGFHYEHLSTGGEFATHVLVLMYLLGPFLPPAYQY